MKKALIFDIDGTLWDSRRPVAIAWDHIIKQETGKSQGLNAENVSYLFGKHHGRNCSPAFSRENQRPAEWLLAGNVLTMKPNTWLVTQEPCSRMSAKLWRRLRNLILCISSATASAAISRFSSHVLDFHPCFRDISVSVIPALPKEKPSDA